MAEVKPVMKTPIFVSVDPGYDATKIIINGEKYIFPRDIVDITGEKSTGSKSDKYLVSYLVPGRRYYIGKIAREQALSKQTDLNRGIQQSEEYFRSTAFKISVISSLAVALVSYKNQTNTKGLKLDNISKDHRIIMGVALPHSYVEDLESTIIEALAGEYNFDIETSKERVTLGFEIEKNSIAVTSQALCAFLSAIADDDCRFDRNKNSLLAHLPALVVDGGYRTVGIFRFSKGELIEEDRSYTDFSAFVIYNKVAEYIKANYKTEEIVTDLVINSIINDSDDEEKIIQVINEDGNYEPVDLMPLFEKATQEVFQEFTKTLEKEYKLSSIKSILLAGGTGAMLYKNFRDYLAVKFTNNAPPLVLADNEFMGKESSPEYAIAVGLYKLVSSEYKQALENYYNNN